MPEFILTPVSNVGNPDGSHSGCSLCGSIEGPFVSVVNTTFRVNTANGPIVSDAPLQFCAPMYDPTDSRTILRQGCVGTMALKIGYAAPHELELAQVSIGDAHTRISEVEGERDELIREVAKLKANPMQVVSVDDLQKLLTDAGKATA